MKWIVVASLLLLPLPFAQADEASDEVAQAAAAVKILTAWQQLQPQPGERYLHLVCWTPADRELPAQYHVRLDGIMKHIQAFYGQALQQNGFGERTIRLPLDAEGKVRLHVVQGLHPMQHYGKQSGAEIRKECLPVLAKAGIDASHETIVIFCNLANWDEKQLRFSHNSPYYAGGTNLSGTAWQLDSPELSIENLILKQPLVRDGEYGQISLGKHNSIFIGGIAHELGHALGLPHCAPRPDQLPRGTSLMGSGNRTYGDELRGEGRGTFLTFAHALRLASHSQFSGSLKQLETPPQLTVQHLKVQALDQRIELSGQLSGEPPVYGIVAYFDPAGKGDYDSTTTTAVPFEQGHFTLRTSALARGQSSELRLVPLHCNGLLDREKLSQLVFTYRVAADGTPDLSAMQLRLELKDFLAALATADRAAAARFKSSLRSEQAQRIAAQLFSPQSATHSPANVADTEKTVSLSALLPQAAKVGWRSPTYNRLPDPSALLEANGTVYETGIYAHAPARHEYTLQARWKRLSGQVALAAGHAGSVEFELQGDGRTLWQSKVVKDKTLAFDVDIANVQTLVLLTSAGEDGTADDWGLWLAPLLSR